MTADSKSTVTAAILVFAREPIEGKVKSRLAPALSENQRTRLYKQLLSHCVATAAHSDGDCILWTTPSRNHPFIVELAKKYDCRVEQQIGDDLGERMANAARVTLAQHPVCVIIGSDCPFYTPNFLNSAIERLETADAVMGPASDGGYVLIGAKTTKTFDQLMENVVWGSSSVASKTRDNAQRYGISLAELPMLSDIDRPEDLELLNGLTWFEWGDP